MWIQNCQCDDTTGVGTTVDVTDGVRDKMISRKSHNDFSKLYTQKQSSIGALMESCSENDFNKVVLFCKGCSPVNLMHIFRTPFPKNTYGRLLLIQFSSSINYLVYRSCFDTWTASSSVLREINNCFITNEISKKWIINLLGACLINSKNIPINAKNHFHNSKLKKDATPYICNLIRFP